MTISIQGATKGFSRAAVEELISPAKRAAMAAERRLQAWEIYERTPLPKRTDEEWRRTDIRNLPLDDVARLPNFSGRISQRDELPETSTFRN